MNNKDTFLAQPIQIGKKTASNRFAINAMECCDGDSQGNFTESTYKRYRNLFEGNAGVIVFESVTIQDESRARDRQLSFQPNNPENIKQFAKFVKEMKEINSKPLLIVQLDHSGELSQDDFSKRICVKPLYGFEGVVVDEEYVDNTIEQFVEASRLLYDIGADGVDLKFCHGYFGSQILRPYNDRKWKYGGPWENRSRFAFDMIEKIGKLVNDPEFIIGSKVSMWEAMPGGQGTAGPDTPIMDLTEPIALCKGLEARGASFIIQSSGNVAVTVGLLGPNRRKPDDVYHHFTMAKVLRENLKPETVVVGSAYSLLNNGKNQLRAVSPEWNSLKHWGNYNIEHKYVDMVAIGRQSLADPKFPAKYLADRENEINWCKACDCCAELLGRQRPTGCVVHSKYYRDILEEARKSVK